MKTKKYFQLFLVCALCITFVTVACKKKKDDPDVIGPTNTNGLGDNAGFPTGTVFSFPPYVTIIGDIRGGEDYGKSIYTRKDKRYLQLGYQKQTKENWEPFGSGSYVDLYIKFFNALNIDTSVTLPGGLIFIDSTKVYQHGLILQPLVIPLFANDTTFAKVKSYCINMNRDPSDWLAVYYTGPTTNNSELVKIISILKAKDQIAMDNYSVVSEVQTIIWDVTDYNQVLSQAQINYLNSLP